MAPNPDESGGRSLDFGGTATKLSRTPLGIIALFIVLVYAMASIVLGLGRLPPGAPVAPLVWFLVVFPCVVLGCFVWLVATRPRNLYGPGDFPDAKDYLALVGLANVPEQQRVTEAQAAPQLGEGKKPSIVPPPSDRDEALVEAFPKAKAVEATSKKGPMAAPHVVVGSETPVVEDVDVSTVGGRIEHRKALYERTRKLFLVHVLTRTAKPNQKYGVGLFIKHHDDRDLSDVRSAEFFLGKAWGNRILVGTPSGNRIGISTSAFGPFLCTCLVTFTDGEQVMLYRYVDFEMGPVVDGTR